MGNKSCFVRRASTRLILLAALLFSACTLSDVGPINTHVAAVGPPSPRSIPNPTDGGATVVGLAISGGGTRAAAFGYGVLRGLDEVEVDGSRTLVDDIRMISGTSGGAVTAAYFGLKGRGYVDLRERFLLADAEKELHKSPLSPANWVRIYNGGANDLSTFAAWLDRNVFDGSTYSAFRRPGAPTVWINASDIYNGTPFTFTHDTFAALCSDLDQLPIAHAVASSANFPVVFAPIAVSTTRAAKCNYRQPEWLTRALADPDASVRVRAFARALDTYQNDPAVAYIKLLDGGLTDNIGVTGFSLERASSGTPYGPLSSAEAVRLRTFVFIVADAGTRTEGDWVQTLSGPKFPQMVDAISNAGIRSSVRDELDALTLAVQAWRGELVAWRCRLSRAEILRHRGTLAGWDCRDVRLVVEDLTFDDFPPAERERLNAIETRLKLPAAQVDLLVAAGRDALHDNSRLREAFARIQRSGGVEPQTASMD
jgi:predicted acylesterase/phospholipase RssA